MHEHDGHTSKTITIENNHEIDWKAIFDYFDKRKTEAKNTKYALYNEVERVLKILEPYREELIG